MPTPASIDHTPKKSLMNKIKKLLGMTALSFPIETPPAPTEATDTHTPPMAIEQQTPEAEERRRAIIAQNDAEATYAPRRGASITTYTISGIHDFDTSSYRIDILPSNAKPTPEQIALAMEREHAVKHIPKLREQAQDESRTNRISFTFWNETYTMTEGEALRHTVDMLRYIVAHGRGSYERRKAKSFLDDMSFVGRKEYQEAARGIAAYWRKLLDDDPTLTLYIVGDGISNNYAAVKSDQYLFNTILGNFSDSQLAEYADRLVQYTDETRSAIKSGDNYRVILLDDWIISGSQMNDAAHYIMNRVPQCDASRIEIHNVIATPQRVAIGLQPGNYEWREGLRPIVRSYYLANEVDTVYASRSGAHISGAHSTVDFDFQDPLDDLIQNTWLNNCDRKLEAQRSLAFLTKVVRVYYDPHFRLNNIKRLQAIKAANVSTGKLPAYEVV